MKLIYLKFKKPRSILSISICLVLIGCGGGAGSASTPPNVSNPPIKDPEPLIKEPEPPIKEPEPPIKEPEPPVFQPINVLNPELGPRKYNADNYKVSEPDTSRNIVKVGVIDSGLRQNDMLKHAVKEVYQVVDLDFHDNLPPEITRLTKDLEANPNVDLSDQDIGSSMHGTTVASVIAAKEMVIINIEMLVRVMLKILWSCMVRVLLIKMVDLVIAPHRLRQCFS